MPLFNVPFLPDEAYIRFLNGKRKYLHSLHFSLFSAVIPDGRHKFRFMDADTLCLYLKQIPGPKKYALLNSRFIHPDLYRDVAYLQAVTEKLKYLTDSGELDGIVFSDFYYLLALSDADNETAARLEAVPSINCMSDSFEKISAQRDMISATSFRMPGKIILDRSLNRNPALLSSLVSRCRSVFPGIKTELLANEGCIYQCPFKAAHDAHIALHNIRIPVDTFEMNRDYGCMRYFRNRPWLLFKSPFIRPEDLKQYDSLADIIKICGRTLGVPFLMKTVSAYTEGIFSGNLPELLDTTEWMSEEFDIPNPELPDDFFRMLTDCTKECRDCGYCRNLFDTHAHRRPFRLRDLRNEDISTIATGNQMQG